MDNSTTIILIIDLAVVVFVIYLLRRKILSKLDEVEDRHVMGGVRQRKALPTSEEE
jgi:hypothetical protein